MSLTNQMKGKMRVIWSIIYVALTLKSIKLLQRNGNDALAVFVFVHVLQVMSSWQY